MRGGKDPKIRWWNDEIKAAVEKRSAAWKVVLRTRDEVTEKSERLKAVYIRARR